MNDEQRREQIAKQIEQIKSGEHPALTGSPKQVAWAEKIRTNYLERVLARIALYEQFGGDMLRSGLADLAHNATFYLSQTEATWWIDNRNDMKVR